MRFHILAGCVLAALATPAHADTTPQSLPFTQNWTDIGLITANNNWAGVPGIEGFNGRDDTGSPTGVDPQTVLTIPPNNAINVLANQTNPNTNTTGGVAEFEITDPVVALQGSGNADYPHLLIHLNTTGAGSVRVRYNVRDIDGSGDDAVQPVALQYRIGNTGNFVNVPEAFIADATTGPNLAELVTAVDVLLPAAVANQPLVQLRIITSNALGNDEWVGIDDIQITAAGGGPTIAINDVSVTEGNSGTTAATFTVTSSVAAPAGGIGFTVDTADGTATAPGDYAAIKAQAFTIPEGQTTVDVTVNVVGDTDFEPAETFRVLLSNASGATITDGEGVGTINNDDAAVAEIFQIQGSGAASPFVGQVVTSNDNIVTALAPNGFFMQTPESRDDGDALTSNGIFVFTGTPRPANIAVGDQVDVTGTIVEFFGFTQFSGPDLVINRDSGGNALPPAVIFDATVPSPVITAPSCAANADPEIANFECFEGMRVAVPQGIAQAGNQFFATDRLAEIWAKAGTSRARREPGVLYPGFAGLPASVPIYDGNPELFEVDVDRLGLPNLMINGGTRFSAEGVIGYEFNDYELWPTRFEITEAVTLPRPVSVPSLTQISLGTLNLLRLFNPSADDNTVTLCAGATPPTATYTTVSTPEEYNRRLSEFATYILTVMRAPELLAVQEIENLAVLTDLSDRIRLLSGGAVSYAPYLVEGNDVGGIDSGWLVLDGLQAAITVEQVGKNEIQTGITPPSCLHDRPPLKLTFDAGPVGRFVLFNNHLRSLNGIGDCNQAAPGRICRKRLEQAQSVAAMIQAEQTASALTGVVSVGDHNAFEFTDGHVNVIGQIAGVVNPAEQQLSAAIVTNPPLSIRATSLPEAERYTFINAGRELNVLDHFLVSTNLLPLLEPVQIARGNADAPRAFETDRLFANGAESATAVPYGILRVSDHDGAVLRLNLPALAPKR
jgi:predicted extracellular nuclease